MLTRSTAGNGGDPHEPTAVTLLDLERLAGLIRGRRVAVLTGAGCSTESGVPDYRGPGARRRNPVLYREFVGDPHVRARYWARSTVGWAQITSAIPNPAHEGLAELERLGIVVGVITQNVDGLHHRAGSKRVIELHGSLARVRCLGCGAIDSRAGLQRRLVDLNPGHSARSVRAAPDGDAEVYGEDTAGYVVPACVRCGGVLRPDVVFFGENVPKQRVDRAWSLYGEADALLVVGSSLAVYSGYRFLLRAVKDARPIAIVNVGETRGDEHAAVKVDGRAGAVLEALVGKGRSRAPAQVAQPDSSAHYHSTTRHPA